MINDKIFEAIQWAQRHCIDQQKPFADNVTVVFLKEMQEKYGKYLSEYQIEHLKTDLCRYLKEAERMSEFYKEYQPSQTAYDYLNYLNTLDGNEENIKLPKNFSVFKMVYWAAMYCITRRSYAALYGNDVVEFLPEFKDSEIKFLEVSIENYILEHKAKQELNKETEIYDYLPDPCWFTLLKFLKDWDNGKFVKVTTVFEEQENTWICFEDNKGNFRKISDYLSNPGRYIYISPEFITSTEILNKKTDIHGR